MPSTSYDTPDDIDARNFALAMAKCAYDTKGEDISVLHVAPIIYWTSYMVRVGKRDSWHCRRCCWNGFQNKHQLGAASSAGHRNCLFKTAAERIVRENGEGSSRRVQEGAGAEHTGKERVGSAGEDTIKIRLACA